MGNIIVDAERVTIGRELANIKSQMEATKNQWQGHKTNLASIKAKMVKDGYSAADKTEVDNIVTTIKAMKFDG